MLKEKPGVVVVAGPRDCAINPSQGLVRFLAFIKLNSQNLSRALSQLLSGQSSERPRTTTLDHDPWGAAELARDGNFRPFEFSSK